MPVKRAIAALAGIFALRMFGLFLLLPVLAIHAANFPDATPLLIGLAFGIYGLTQGALQIPFGIASDRFGRRRIITLGLLIFAAGSIIAAVADSVAMLILGRAIQGAGAISAAILALTADLTHDQDRTAAMAVIGVSIGAVFLLSLIIAPPLQSIIGVAGIFHLSAGLAVAAIALLWLAVPAAPAAANPDSGTTVNFPALLKHRRLLQLNFGVFCLHLILTALFVALPPLLLAGSGLPLADHWQLYAPVLILSAAGMLPLLIAEKRRPGPAFITAVALLCIATVALAGTTGTATNLPALLIALWLFFVAFNALEAMLPAMVSRAAPPAARGAALGVHSTCQFLGMFAGGVCGGSLFAFGASAVFWFCAAAAAVWLALAASP